MNEQIISKFQEYKLTLIPLKEDSKKPKTKYVNGDWHWKPKHGVEWSANELKNSKRLGVLHEAGLFDCDADADEAPQFMSMLPDTLTIGKEVNGQVKPTHKLYVYNGNKKTESLGKEKDCGTVVELLQNTQTHVILQDSLLVFLVGLTQP